MIARHRAVVKNELRAIKRAMARIESTFEGVSTLLRRAQRTALTAARPAHRAKTLRAK